MNRRRAALLVVTTVAAVLLGSTVTAHATSYRYWTYWTSTGTTWTFSAVGPASVVPADGAVEGWRFAVSEGVRGPGESPRIAANQAFDQFCGGEAATPGSKRVAVVFDFGDPADAPTGQTPPAARGTCVVVPTAATGARILSQAAAIRTDRGLVCAIGGYPADECAPAIAATPQPKPTPSPAQPRSPSPNESRDRSDGVATPAAKPDPATPRADPGAEQRNDSPAPSERNQGNGDSTPATGDPAKSTEGAANDAPADPRGSASDPAVPAATVDEAAAAVAPTFIEADATELDAATARPWLPGAVTGVALLGLVAFVWLRRRS